MIIALVGNQNCGKTTLFNQLTGANRRVGNFPGVTVDAMNGEVKGHSDMTVVDLPGIYSIRPYSQEEIVTRDFILESNPDVILNIVDATNIERNLYLTVQLLAMQLPTVIALNMMDEVRSNGGYIDVKKLSVALGVPVVPISAAKNEGIDELISVVREVVKSKQKPKVYDFCDRGPVHRCIHSTVHIIEDHAQNAGVSSRFAATKLIEGDEDILRKLGLDDNERELIAHSIKQMEDEGGMDANALLADMRYTFIERVCAQAITKKVESKERARSIKIDNIVTDKWLALPIFIAAIVSIFYLSFSLIGGNLSTLLEMVIEKVTNLTQRGLEAWGVSAVVQSLVLDGIFAGIGSVLSFIPIILTLFFFLSILEDTGYMARVAFVMDKLLRKIGLSGRSIVPMLIGFGCSVPAIMATRTLSSDRDRKFTIMLVPFMSCSAKIPIYTFFAAAFFPKYAWLVMCGLYFGGIVIGILFALILKIFVKGKPVPFVMELPNYRLPSAKSVALLIWEKAKDFIKKAFTIIFLATIIIWFLNNFDYQLNFISDGQATSLLEHIAQAIAVIFKPLGFGNWQSVTALIAGFSAKEAVVSILEVLGDITALFDVKSAISFLVFTLLYTPCMAAVATVKKEFGGKHPTLITIGLVILQCAVAYVCSLIVYQLLCLF